LYVYSLTRSFLAYKWLASLPKDPNESNDDDGEEGEDDVCGELERVAHLCHFLSRQVEEATRAVSTATAATTTTTTGASAASAAAVASTADLYALPPDTERAGFVLHLAPRVRKVEFELVRMLAARAEAVLLALARTDDQQGRVNLPELSSQLLVQFGSLVRGFLVLGRGRDVERLFATVAVLPSLNLSMGRLDEGGARGECAGLASYLHQVVTELAAKWSHVLRCSLMLDPQCWGLDLVTSGVWVPIVTTLTADAGIQMAIFSPGIASILQANYVALDRFVAGLAQTLLAAPAQPPPSRGTADRIGPASPWEDMYQQPTSTPDRARLAQARIYAHPKTAEFSKKWNLPIYYQLRFGECCTRLNRAIDGTMREGWIAQVFSGDDADVRVRSRLELPLFLELYDVLLFLWKPNVLLKPLTNRFLRGATQLIGRIVSFCKDGLDGTIRFGENGVAGSANEMGGEPLAGSNHGSTLVENSTSLHPPPQPSSLRHSWSWSESEQDVAAVAWELSILESAIRTDYTGTIWKAISIDDDSDTNQSELRTLVAEVLQDAVEQISPLIDSAWNDCIVKLLTSKCSAPLSAVKGVAATYRMTNRPPPTQASPFVATVLRPLKEFNGEFGQRVPGRVGARWKQQIVVTVSDRYAAAVEELLTTVQRTEVALSSRRARRVTTAGGMSDGDKVKLQVYLDYQRFAQSVVEVGVEPASVIGLSRLQTLTAEGETFAQKSSENGT
jgi:conserved oligomeric Golgi complex subunit 2